MKHRVFFFAGGDHREGEGNAFTSNFIRYLSIIFGQEFSVIRDIYHTSPLMNVIWALNRAQEPVRFPEKNRIIATSVGQIIRDSGISRSELTLVSSSYGSVVAAQAACFLAGRQMREPFLAGPFHLALGASMVSVRSGLYGKLLHYQKNGIIGKILYDDLQDDGDNSTGIGGSNRLEAYVNGLGICFPYLSPRHRGPSFLNNDPVSGHLHRVRAQSIQKAEDFVHTILIHHRLGGEEAKRKAEELLRQSSLIKGL
jgi:hypothetical protein